MNKLVRHAALVLFTVFGVPLLIATPFLLSGSSENRNPARRRALWRVGGGGRFTHRP